MRARLLSLAPAVFLLVLGLVFLMALAGSITAAASGQERASLTGPASETPGTPDATDTPNATSVADTPTIPLPVGTSVPTATACAIQYTDVCLGNPFYIYVRCLSCQGIVGGYTSSPPCVSGAPCFLPSNNVTRGQLAKFVSNAAGYDDTIPPEQQSFTDVPHSSPFWLYVERAHAHGVIGGYTSSPPCPGGAPCFLPSRNVTRGQISKFISIAFFPDCVMP
jgi:hypothetical protein